MVAHDLIDVTTDPEVIGAGGWWAVVMTYEGHLVAARFATVRPGLPGGASWIGPAVETWETSLHRTAYLAGVEQVRDHIAAGEVYQANVCRVLRAPLPDAERSDIEGLSSLLARGNPAPYAGFVRLPDKCHANVPAGGLHVATASPELYLRRVAKTVESGPIKGTGRTAADLSDKDRAENVMIVDLVRNDLGAVCRTGSVTVPALLSVELHPGLVHLVSRVSGTLSQGAGWPELFAATFPPGSVTGAPKISAVRLLAGIEPVPRGPYCGAIGWINGDRGCLAVGIRTFWRDGDDLMFGTGAGITWGSDAAKEWDETELKAATLLAVAAGRWQGGLS